MIFIRCISLTEYSLNSRLWCLSTDLPLPSQGFCAQLVGPVWFGLWLKGHPQGKRKIHQTLKNKPAKCSLALIHSPFTGSEAFLQLTIFSFRKCWVKVGFLKHWTATICSLSYTLLLFPKYKYCLKLFTPAPPPKNNLHHRTTMKIQ